jgi:Cdc6-like AAA superfamily ATPase
MPLAESILTVVASAAGIGSAVKDLADFLTVNVKIEAALTDLVEESFQERLPRLRHLCIGEGPTFDRGRFRDLLTATNFEIRTVEGLRGALLPILNEAVSAPGAMYKEEDFIPVYESILSSALRGLWKKIGSYELLPGEILMGQCEALLKQLDAQRLQTTSDLSVLQGSMQELTARVESLQTEMRALASYASGLWQQVYDKLSDAAPPSEHRVGENLYRNPFLLVRAEDFNHNYAKLARLFQNSPEWDSIQSRTENVFIEGGRGTGKSMFLRRLTAQASLAAGRLQKSAVDFEGVGVDYFGVYVKLTRGYYEQFTSIETINNEVASIFAQHELNIEIFDAFVDTLQWLINEGALPSAAEQADSLTQELKSLLPRSPGVRTLSDLQNVAVRFEQDQITTYYREKAFGRDVPYQGSGCETVGFLRQLSQIFRRRLFPRREIRLFILIDEFESLLEIQQIALNTVMKMRLPDLTTKVAVRKTGRKTAETFTASDPIQQPRDYTEVRLDYDVTLPEYSRLLEGIAAKRLEYVQYPDKDIKHYLQDQDHSQEVSGDKLQVELRQIWESGQRRKKVIDADFTTMYTVAAVYRSLAKVGKRKAFCGFDQYVLLSSGITSNFIELCKYAFYFALYDQLPLREKPKIPPYLQTEAAYRVSQRLFSTIEGNVPRVGSALSRLLADLGRILRGRLLYHPSEPEANRLAVSDFGDLGQERYSFLAEVLDGAIVWSVLHLKSPGEAFRPKRAALPPNAELIINRIYCPAFGISPRARWRVDMKLVDLLGLIHSDTREETFQRLVRSAGSSPPPDSPQAYLFEEQEPLQ